MLRKLHRHVPAEYHESGLNARGIQDRNQRSGGGGGAVEPAVVAFPWWLIVLAAPFVTTFREMLEVRYLWRIPLRMDNAHYEAVIGTEPHTPLDQAVETTLMGLGCLDALETRSPEQSLVSR
jgi:hypothetical protein